MKEIIFAIRNSRISFKVRQHNTDPTLAVIKSSDPEVGALVAFGAGIDVIEAKKGSRYHLTIVNKQALMENFGTLAKTLYEGNLVLAPKFSDEAVGPAIPSVVDSIEDLSEEFNNDDDENDD